MRKKKNGWGQTFCLATDRLRTPPRVVVTTLTNRERGTLFSRGIGLKVNWLHGFQNFVVVRRRAPVYYWTL